MSQVYLMPLSAENPPHAAPRRKIAVHLDPRSASAPGGGDAITGQASENCPAEFVPPEGWSCYRCLLWDHEAVLDPEEEIRLARALVRSGCRYAVCAGRNGSDWDDLIDHVFVDENLADIDEAIESRHVMTTWHDGEAPDEVAFFFVTCTCIEDDRSGNYLVLHIGDGAEREILNRAVCRHVEESPGFDSPSPRSRKPRWKFW